MATSRSFGDFAKRMHIRANQIAENSEIAIRKAAIAADQGLVLSTPVDTGRARANWNASVNSIEETLTAQVDPSGQATMDQARAVIEGWKLGAGTIFLANSVPYIIPLEEGHSQQAPSGMTRHGLAAAHAELKKAKLLKE